jgi:hypothetical protein
MGAVALSDAVEAARRDLGGRDDGQLLRARRHAVLRALGEGDRGRGARARLARDTVEHVMPLWRDARPGDHDPERLLGLIEPALAGLVDPDEAQRALGLLWAHVDNLIATTGPEPPLHVGYAASRALRAALRDERLDPPDADPALTDVGQDPRLLDTAYIASIAAAGGAPRDGHGDAEKRRAFWSWWLERAAKAEAGGASGPGA